ncbi:YceI family protein [Amycolatopsis sp. NPDC004747]
MTTTTGSAEPAAPRRRKRHWLRWTLAALVAVIVLVVVTVQLYVANAPAPAPLTLPAATEQPTGPLAGTWEATGGSAAGLRIRQTVLFAEGDVVQRTQAVTGQLAATATAITTATFAVDLTTLTDDGTANGRKTPQVAISLDTGRYPTATIALSRPADVGAGFGSGATVTTTTPAAMTLRGRTHPVTVTLTARRDGDLLRAAGSFPVAFADWGIAAPEGYGALGSLADHGTAEFLLVLRRH